MECDNNACAIARFLLLKPFDGKLKTTVLPAKSDSDFMSCLQSYQGLIINRSLVYSGV